MYRFAWLLIPAVCFCHPPRYARWANPTANPRCKSTPPMPGSLRCATHRYRSPPECRPLPVRTPKSSWMRVAWCAWRPKRCWSFPITRACRAASG